MYLFLVIDFVLFMYVHPRINKSKYGPEVFPSQPCQQFNRLPLEGLYMYIYEF